MEIADVCKLIKKTVDSNMANGVATELRTRGYEPEDFTILAYGGNGPLHACGIADALGVTKILAPPYAAVFSACGAGSMSQMHIHEMSTWTVLFDANRKTVFTDYECFNRNVEELELRGREDLLRQGFEPAEIKYRLEVDMRYGNQRVQTAVVTNLTRLNSQHDVLQLIQQFHESYGDRFGQGSQAPEAGVRINTLRVCTFVDQPGIAFANVKPNGNATHEPVPVATRACHFVDHDAALDTAIYDETALVEGAGIAGPALVVSRATTYLVEPGWVYRAAAQQAVWFTKVGA
jgi:N-methylhydantoinase A